ncbi:MAG: quinone oxidoreductase family protein, partial [Candidatus Binatia bacterium]
SYAEVRNVPAERLVRIPPGVSDQQAAAIMLKGLTAWYLLRRTYRVKRGDSVLIHAAAGGVGLIACQWARYLGAKVIGVVSNEDKARLARRHGCQHVIIGHADLPRAVKSLTRGAGVNVVYDAVGKDTFFSSLDSLKPLGMMVSYGNASGAVPPVDPGLLAQKGALFLTRPTLATYTANRADLVKSARELFAVVKKGGVKVAINQTYPLQEAAQAHRDLEARKTTGSTLLLP